ncbi:MAG: PolC-type DNA polymerase III [Peptoniphilaceae bacterium]
MIKFNEILKKLNIEDENLNKDNIKINSIKFNDKSLELSINIVIPSELNVDLFSNFEKTIQNKFKDFIVNFNYEIQKELYSSEEELIKNEIQKYNPSSSIWIEEILISKDTMTSSINISLPNEGIYYSVTKNGLKDLLVEKLKYFGDYKVKFLEPEKSYSCEIDTFVENFNKEEIELTKNLNCYKEADKNKKKLKEKTSTSKNYSYGKKDIGEISNIKDINLNMSKVTIKGDVFSIDAREIKNKKFIICLSVTDYTSSIVSKIFLSTEKKDEFLDNISIGSNVIITGNMQYDTYNKEDNIMIRYCELTNKYIKEDKSIKKRVELKLHSKMSSMNGVTSFDDFAKRIKLWGMDSIAITDKSDVQGFPEAMEASKKYDLKIIYGLDANFVDDEIQIIKNFNKDSSQNQFVVFDIETTGFSPRTDKITEIGAVKISNGEIIDRFSQLINPEKAIPQKVVELTGISNALVENEPKIDEVIKKFYEFSKDSVLVAHNATFDISFIRKEMLDNGLDFNYPVLDTLPLARASVKGIKRFNLGALSKKLGVSLTNAHRAVHDAEATAEVFLKILDILEKEEIRTFDEINSLSNRIDSASLFESSLTILVKNQKGLKNLYKLVSESHMNYVNRVAKVPRSLVNKYRDGLLLGSGNHTSPLYKAVFNKEDSETIENIASYYDFIEIQPVRNNLNYVLKELVKDYKELQDINKELYELGKKLSIPVVATGDVYYLEESDDLVRRIILNGQSGRPPENIDIPQELYLRTTEEMLKEFNYLGQEESYEVVVKNSNMINDMIENLKPIPDGTYPPVIEGAEIDLKNMCYEKAHEIYGENLPEIVETRLKKELDSIISNGYAVLYIISQKLVKKSNEDGYLVGSRGSVGSSFAATMSSITEVNPLPPHYICDNCKYSEFIDDVKIGSGVDLPDKICPECGATLKKDGHNIPFEVFLGFNGDKEPDIDLNFAGEYQPKAHKYTEDLFGKGYVFRAGTIGTVAEKTAYGYVRKFYEDSYIPGAEIDRLSKAAIGVKRTSGQHPGGVMICPKSKEIFDFTPIQYPADDKNSGVITTHFDYNFIHGKILKLDILGHDGPTIIRMLEDFTGIDSTTISLSDKDTVSLFSSSEKLNLDNNIFETSTGTLGIPEFGTNFVKQMLLETQPKNFSDLVRISGLSHGTDVWTNNAQELVKKGRATLSNVICTREDIMLYLIKAGAENKMAFETMEKVRKGKGLTDEQKLIMKDLDLPEWYIESCEKIKYMFPKAHAVAYVMLSFRIAYYKLNYPLAFYATYFTIKLSDFDGELIVKGIDAIKLRLEELKNQENKLTAKDKGQITVLEVASEMYARGYTFENANVYKSSASKFKIKDGKVLLPLRAYSGIGEQVAINIVKESKIKEFLSIEDLVKRTKATKSVIETLKNNNIIANLPESNQLSLFNLI